MQILHIDPHAIVLDKPAGLSVLPEGWDRDAPCVVALLEREHGRVWMVHRLDKLTSGVMVVARNPEVHRQLNAQFAAHEVVKVYHAVAVGVPHWRTKRARHPLRANAGHRHRTVLDSTSGKPSRTDFRVLQTAPEHVLLEARPLTGRTHQVRAHAYLLGFPLLGDPLYGPGPSDLIGRPALHAYSIALRLPAREWKPSDLSGETPQEPWHVREFTAALPQDMQSLIDRIFGRPVEQSA